MNKYFFKWRGKIFNRIVLSFVLKNLTYGDLMLIRSNNLGVDVGLSALQGYVGAQVYNLIKGASLINPLHSAVAFGGIALAEKVFYMASSRVIPGPTLALGPIALGPKNLVSSGLAIYTTLKVMHVAGLILSMPFAISMVGLVSGGALIAGGVIKAIQNYGKVTVEQHIASPTFANRVYRFSDGLLTYSIRIICNPEGKNVHFSFTDGSKLSTSRKYIVAFDELLPEHIREDLDALFQRREKYECFSEFSRNGIFPVEYTANPSVA